MRWFPETEALPPGFSVSLQGEHSPSGAPTLFSGWQLRSTCQLLSPDYFRLFRFHCAGGKPFVCPFKSTLPPPVPNTISSTVSSILPGSQRKMLSPAWPMHPAMGKGLFLFLRTVLASEFPNALTAPLRPPVNQTVPCIGLWSRFAITPLCWVPAACFQCLSLKIFLSLWEQTGVHILQTGIWDGANSVLFLLCTGLGWGGEISKWCWFFFISGHRGRWPGSQWEFPLLS